MEIKTVALADEASTMALGAALAPILESADVVRLEGDLGAGKTTLARAVISALTGLKEAPSPTFTLVETYETDNFLLWHFDLYRLDRAEDVWELGIEEALISGVSLIEWPDRAGRMLPEGALSIKLRIDGGGRRAALAGDARWRDRLEKAGIA